MNRDRKLQEAVAGILKQDPRYHADAYEFVADAVSHMTAEMRKREGGGRHISGQELLEGIRGLALDQYGPLALDVLTEWGLSRTEDFGEIVFNLVEHKLLGASEEDSRQDFANSYDFHEAFLKPFVETGDFPTNLPKIA